MSIALFCISDLQSDLAAAKRLAGGDPTVPGHHRRGGVGGVRLYGAAVIVVPGNHGRDAEDFTAS